MSQTLQPYDRVVWRGVTLNRRTVAMLELAEARCHVPIVPTQGSYNAGGVSASAGTHDGGGAVDLSVAGLVSVDKRRLVHALRDVGFAAWRRPYIEKVWPEHVHAIALGDREASDGARAQMRSYRDGRDGLAGNGVDPDPYRPDPIREFDFAKWRRRTRIKDAIAALLRKLKRLRGKL